VDLSIVVPCFNEADNVGLLAKELLPVVEGLRRERTTELILVDDGSTDGTGDLLESELGRYPHVRVVRHERNRGLGAAIRTGFAHAVGDVVITAESDATAPFHLIRRLLEMLEPGVDMVIASYHHPEGGSENVPRYRIVLSKGASFMYRVLLDWRIYTYTCLFRAYRRRVVATVPFESDGFLSQAELVANALLGGFVVRELPFTLRVRRNGTSKARIARIVASHLRFQAKLLLIRLGLRRPPEPLPAVSPQILPGAKAIAG